MIKIDVRLNNAYNWEKDDGDYFIGHIYYKDKFYYNSDALNLIKSKVDNIQEFLKEIDGRFTFVLELKEKIVIASDRLRVFPIFYSIENDNDIIITDDIMSYSNKKLNEEGIEEIDSMRMCYII